jgi:hypothetical protein
VGSYIPLEPGEKASMILYCILSGLVFFGIFVLFLVLSKTLNNILNNLIKLQYLLQKELDLKKEQLAITKLMEEEQTAAGPADEPEEDKAEQPSPENKTKK